MEGSLRVTLGYMQRAWGDIVSCAESSGLSVSTPDARVMVRTL